MEWITHGNSLSIIAQVASIPAYQHNYAYYTVRVYGILYHMRMAIPYEYGIYHTRMAMTIHLPIHCMSMIILYAYSYTI